MSDGCANLIEHLRGLSPATLFEAADRAGSIALAGELAAELMTFGADSDVAFPAPLGS